MITLTSDRLHLTHRAIQALNRHGLDRRALHGLTADRPVRRTADALLVTTGDVVLVLSVDGRRLIDVRSVPGGRRSLSRDAGCTAHRPSRHRRDRRNRTGRHS